jgi:hypothetical protein
LSARAFGTETQINTCGVISIFDHSKAYVGTKIIGSKPFDPVEERTKWTY